MGPSRLHSMKDMDDVQRNSRWIFSNASSRLNPRGRLAVFYRTPRRLALPNQRLLKKTIVEVL